MKNYISFFRSNYFLNIIILLFITFVFINFIHNNSGNYQSGNIKAEVSDQLTSNETYAHILERKCEITGNMHDRHKVRWLKLLALKNIFQISSNINKSLPYYLNILLHSFILFFSFILIKKTFSTEKKYILLFLLYITFVFQQYLGEYSYSIFEMFFLSLALYSSKNKNHLLFLATCILAVLNRESGFIILLTWLIFNSEYKKVLAFSLLTSAVFIVANYQILDCLINPEFFIPLGHQEGQVNFDDLKNINIFSLGKLLVINFLFPFGLGIYFYLTSKIKNKFLLSIFAIYFLVFLFATPLHHIAVRLILIPLIFCSIYFSQLEESNYSKI
tara:strand:+ start:1449 stop:2441 length:993 start_codon:yes stop_codon:yes gene_type:complete